MNTNIYINAHKRNFYLSMNNESMKQWNLYIVMCVRNQNYMNAKVTLNVYVHIYIYIVYDSYILYIVRTMWMLPMWCSASGQVGGY